MSEHVKMNPKVKRLKGSNPNPGPTRPSDSKLMPEGVTSKGFIPLTMDQSWGFRQGHPSWMGMGTFVVRGVKKLFSPAEKISLTRITVTLSF